MALGADGGLVVGAGETGQLALLDAEVAGAEGEAVSTEDAGVVAAAEAFVRTGLALSVPELVALSAVVAECDVVSGAVGAVDGAPAAGFVGCSSGVCGVGPIHEDIAILAFLASPLPMEFEAVADVGRNAGVLVGGVVIDSELSREAGGTRGGIVGAGQAVRAAGITLLGGGVVGVAAEAAVHAVACVGAVAVAAAGWALDAVPGVVVLAKACDAGRAVAVSAPSGTDLNFSVPDLRDEAPVVRKVEVDPVPADFRHVQESVGVVREAVPGVLSPFLFTLLVEKSA